MENRESGFLEIVANTVDVGEDGKVSASEGVFLWMAPQTPLPDFAP